MARLQHRQRRLARPDIGREAEKIKPALQSRPAREPVDGEAGGEAPPGQRAAEVAPRAAPGEDVELHRELAGGPEAGEELHIRGHVGRRDALVAPGDERQRARVSRRVVGGEEHRQIRRLHGERVGHRVEPVQVHAHLVGERLVAGDERRRGHHARRPRWHARLAVDATQQRRRVDPLEALAPLVATVDEADRHRLRHEGGRRGRRGGVGRILRAGDAGEGWEHRGGAAPGEKVAAAHVEAGAISLHQLLQF